MLALQQFAFELATPTFQPIQLSPLAPLGTCSVIGLVDQNKVVSATRNMEVLSDATNVLALEGALKRKNLLKSNPKDKTCVDLCCAHQMVRAQFFDNSDFAAHFNLFGIVTLGSDKGNFLFEKEALIKHLHFYTDFFSTKNKWIEWQQLAISITSIDPLIEEIIKTEIFPFFRKNAQPFNLNWIKIVKMVSVIIKRLAFRLTAPITKEWR